MKCGGYNFEKKTLDKVSKIKSLLSYVTILFEIINIDTVVQNRLTDILTKLINILEFHAYMFELREKLNIM